MPSPLTILHISTRLILGGSQENTVLSCEGQSQLGHRVHLAFGPIYGPEGSMLDRVNAFRTCDGRGIATHTVPDLCREIAPNRDRRAITQLRSLIEHLRPDIVHTHSSKAGILGRVAAWRVHRASPDRRPAVVHTIHGPPFMPVEGPALTRCKTLALNAAYTRAERAAARRCHAIVSVADAMTAQFLARGIGTPDLYTTVRSGMDLGPFLHPAPGEDRASIRATLGLTQDDLVIGTVARLAEHKGHDGLLDALADDLRVNPRWKLLWVGDGWWRDRLLSRVRDLGLEQQVVTTGLVPPERVAPLIRAMDILAHPSLREGLPRTVPQALLAGVVPVASDVDGTREACIDGVTGRLFPPRDRAALRAAIVELAGDPLKRAALAKRGRAMCVEQFSTDAMVRGLEAVYARAIEHARSMP